ncbi:MAG: hypothetical protein JW913_07125 [Chitinispirillaceae bacterium]|nr:hypothetical protein [Chitinispirillaceae bacterium]
MLNKKFLLIMLLFRVVYSNYNGSIFQYTHYQSDNSLTCVRDSVQHPAWKEHQVYLFRPAQTGAKFPVVFFCHGITAEDPLVYGAFIRHIVSRGHAVIYSPYPTGRSYLFPRSSYRILWNGFMKGVSTWDSLLDLSTIGFVGHSYGAGAIPSLARKAMAFNGWGKKGAFLHLMAPWYAYGITQRQLRHFPQHVKVVVEVFADDRINDHRIGKDIYLSIGIPDTSKVFCVLSADASQRGLPADHDVPIGASQSSLSVNDFDFCGVYFIFDALSAYSNDPHAGNARFRHEDRTYLIKGPSGDFCRIKTIRTPSMKRTQGICVNFWCHAMNPRRKIYKHLGEPFRLLLATPETMLNYGTLALEIMGNR